MTDFNFGESAPLLMGILGLVFIGLIALFVVGLRMWQKETASKLAPPEPAAPELPAARPAMTTVPVSPPALAPASPPAVTTITGAAAPTPEPALVPADETIEQLRLLRDVATGGLLVEIRGQRYAQPRDVRDGTHQKILLASLKDFYRFMGQAGLADKVPDQVAPVAPGATGTLHPPAVPMTLDEIRADAQRPLRTPSMNPFQQYKVMREITAVPDLPVLSIAEQIDQVLQKAIDDGPWVLRGLHVQSSPGGDVRFVLDGHAYGSLDEVSDPEARSVLQAAIQTWDQGKSK
jgi:hypothetical protein